MSSVVQTTIEDRIARERNPIWEEKLVFTFASGDTAEETASIPVNGLLQKITVKCSAASGAVVTVTVAIDDNNDDEIWSDSALAESSLNKYNVNEALSGMIDIGVTPSTDPLSAYTVTVTLRGV